MGFEFSAFLMINEFREEYYFLSNFYPQQFNYNGIFYPTAEHAFQAAKAKHSDEMLWVAQAPTPGKAKYRGRQVTLRPDWEHIKLPVMRDILLAKFNITYLHVKLSDTKDNMLVEGNYWHDQFWGNCMCEQHKNTPGNNYLGKILVYIRDIHNSPI